MKNLTGEVIKSYEVKERIGMGGFGAVYLGVQPNVGREVAIKVILPEHANHPEFIKRFEAEAQLVARLEHPYIVPLYDYWREPNSAYLVMRYLRGGSVRDSIDEHGAWDAMQVGQMINQIAAALTFAHRHGVIHRDLKSDNILLDESGNFYLGDFGIAKDLGAEQDLTQDAIVGTPAYLSPEQIRGEGASPKSDIYALGILAYETLTGSKPFVDNSPATVLFKQLNDPLPDLHRIRPDMPDILNDVLQRATSKEAATRYETALTFAREFQTAIRDLVPGAPFVLDGDTVNMMSITQVEQDVFEPKNPYKGLRAFQQADADEFFGRQELVERLIQRLSADGDNDDFLAVVGPSGSGKSSVVKAGLIPRIQTSTLNDAHDWYTIDMVPGTHPLEELEAGLLSIAPREVPGLLNLLGEDTRGLVRAIKRILPRDDAEVVLFIDQFEEVFTLVEDENERSHFLDSIIEAVTDERSRLKVIITIRADFYDRPLLYAKFGELIRRNTELVLPLNEDELRAAIIGPAEKVGLSLEPGLVEAIITDVNEQPGALPLMQYALTELFERREGRQLTLEAYREIGGTAGALARRAEELYQSFDEETRAATRQMFLRLVTLGEGTEDTRRRVMRSELLSISAYSETMQNAINMFGKYRLLTFDHDPQTRSSTVEVAHEALIRQWERVRGWLAENREALRMHRRLTTATEEWLHADRDPSYLARGTRLQQWEEWANDTDIAMTAEERAYLDASVDARENRLAEERAQQEREERLRRRTRNALAALAIVFFIFSVVAFTQFLEARSARAEAEQEAAQAATARAEAVQSETESRSLALAANARNALAANDPLLALPLAIEAQELYSPSPTEVLRTLMSATYAEGPRYRYTQHTGSVTDVKFTADGTYSISASVDGSVRVWNNRTGSEDLVVTVPDVRFDSVAVHPRTTSFAAAASDGMIYVWDFETGDRLQTLAGHEGQALAVVYSPDGLSLATGGTDATVRLWDIESGEETLRMDGHVGVVFQVVFSPDGSRIASSSGDETLLDIADERDRTVRIWDAETGAELLVIEPNSGFVRALDYSPNGETIAYGVWDGTNAGTVRIHDANTGEEIRRFFAHTTPLTEVVYSPDSQEIVSTAWDRNVRIWDIARGTEIQSFTGFTERILGLDYSANDQFLLLGVGNVGDNEFVEDLATDTSVWLWDISNRDQRAVYDAHRDWVWTVDISADGSRAASGGGPLNLPSNMDSDDLNSESLGTVVRVWDVATQETIQTMSGHTNTVDSVKFFAGDEQLLSGSWDGSIIRWDVASGEALDTYTGHEGRVRMLATFDDGNRFVSAGDDGTIRLWDVSSGEATIINRTTTDVTSTADDGTETTISVGVPIWGIDLNAEQTQVAGAYNDGAIRIWDIESGELVQEFCCHNDNVQEARFHPGGEWLVSSSWDNTIRLWDIETGQELRQFAGHNGHTFGIDFSSDGELMLTTSEDTTVRMWEVNSGEEIHRFDSHTNWVQEVVFSPDDTFALSAGQDNVVRVWRIDRTTGALVDYAREIRFIRDLSCAERELYRLEPCPTS